MNLTKRCYQKNAIMEKVKYTRPLVNVVPLQGSCLLDNFNSTKQNQYLDTKNEQKDPGEALGKEQYDWWLDDEE